MNSLADSIPSLKMTCLVVRVNNITKMNAPYAVVRLDDGKLAEVYLNDVKSSEWVEV